MRRREEAEQLMVSRKRNKGKERRAKKAEQEAKKVENERLEARNIWQRWARGEDDKKENKSFFVNMASTPIC